MLVKYRKLVRDNIPEIIKKRGAKPIIRKLDEDEYVVELFKKIKEEAGELIEAKDVQAEMKKEIGDIYEVIDAIIEYYQLDKEKIFELKKERLEKRGGFQKRIFWRTLKISV